MPFNRENLVGIAQKSTSANNYDESKVSRTEFQTHIDYDAIHVSHEDRYNWNKSLQESKDYTDYRFKDIIGKFNFHLIDIDNRRTLSDIILLIYTKLLDKTNITEAECKILVNDTLKQIEELISNKVTSQLNLMNEKLKQIDEVNNKLDLEIENRTNAINNEVTERNNAIDNKFNSVSESLDSIRSSISTLDGKIAEESSNRTKAINSFEESFTRIIDEYDKQIQSMISQYETFINEKMLLVSTLQDKVDALESNLAIETEERKDMDTQILLKINT